MITKDSDRAEEFVIAEELNEQIVQFVDGLSIEQLLSLSAGYRAIEVNDYTDAIELESHDINEATFALIESRIEEFT